MVLFCVKIYHYQSKPLLNKAFLFSPQQLLVLRFIHYVSTLTLVSLSSMFGTQLVKKSLVDCEMAITLLHNVEL